MKQIRDLLSHEDVYYLVVVLLIAVSSFGLGKWSSDMETDVVEPAAVSWTPPPVATDLITDNDVTVSGSDTSTTAGAYVGSKNGTKYHLPDCPGAKQIAEKNLITFASQDAAEAAGYAPAANCPGL